MIGERTITIQASPTAIYAYVSDLTRHIEWNHQPTAVTKITDGPLRVGSVFRAQEQPPSNMNWFMAKVMPMMMGLIMGNKGYTEAEITILESGHRIAWQAAAPGRKGDLMRATWEIVLEPLAEATQVTQHFHFMPQHKMVDRLANGTLAQQVGDEVEHNLGLLKRVLEG